LQRYFGASAAGRRPPRRGFGSRLIAIGLVGTRGADLRYTENGFEGDLTAPLKEIQRT